MVRAGPGPAAAVRPHRRARSIPSHPEASPMTRNRRTPRRRAPLVGSLVRLEDRTTPAVALALSNNAIIRLDTDNPTAALAPVAVTGLQTGDNLVGIDFRPQTGQLYG